MRPFLPFSSCILASLISGALAPGMGQTPSRSGSASASSESVLHTGANLVLVDVVVTDRDKAVHGLARRRFHILEDGHEQIIASFDEHAPNETTHAGSNSGAWIGSLPPHTYSNAPVNGN